MTAPGERGDGPRPAAAARHAADRAAAGLCVACGHARRLTSARGSVFWLCGLSATDARFARYPRLPVVACAGFASASGDAGRGADPG